MCCDVIDARHPETAPDPPNEVPRIDRFEDYGRFVYEPTVAAAAGGTCGPVRNDGLNRHSIRRDPMSPPGHRIEPGTMR